MNHENTPQNLPIEETLLQFGIVDAVYREVIARYLKQHDVTPFWPVNNTSLWVGGKNNSGEDIYVLIEATSHNRYEDNVPLYIREIEPRDSSPESVEYIKVMSGVQKLSGDILSGDTDEQSL